MALSWIKCKINIFLSAVTAIKITSAKKYCKTIREEYLLFNSKLKENYKIYNFAISDKNKISTLNISVNNTVSSLNKLSTNLDKNWPG